MAVIGRLDEQVDAIIISPLSEERRREEPPAPRAERPAGADETGAEHERGARGEELPVWLL